MLRIVGQTASRSVIGRDERPAAERGRTFSVDVDKSARLSASQKFPSMPGRWNESPRANPVPGFDSVAAPTDIGIVQQRNDSICGKSIVGVPRACARRGANARAIFCVLAEARQIAGIFMKHSGLSEWSTVLRSSREATSGRSLQSTRIYETSVFQGMLQSNRAAWIWQSIWFV